ncbi:MAG: ClbS/DfsB family four-helix bundle protein [Chloroflexi bacterium]|nr:ClbS/DfsB family four-helix bundle protein [Chloroflexota bacterium]
MANDLPRTVSELLRHIDEGYTAFTVYVRSMSETTLTGPTDPAGWTIKDHLAHIVVWEDGMNAVLTHQSRIERMGVDQAVWDSGFDEINAFLQQRDQDLPLAEVLARFDAVHQELVPRIAALSDADLQRPVSSFGQKPRRDYPVVDLLAADTYFHYAEHTAWIMVIAGTAPSMHKDELLTLMENAWQELNAWLRGLSEAQFAEHKDAAGWTVKDHLLHLIVWEEGMPLQLDGVPRKVSLAVSEEAWAQGIDAVNAELQQRTVDVPAAEALRRFEETHRNSMARIQALTDEQLHLPFSHYIAGSDRPQPFILWVQGSTYGHYGKHRPWMAEIAEED